jgi:hypothetical protein
MNLIPESHKDEAGAVRRMRDGYHLKSPAKKWMPRINHFDFVGRIERCLGLAQTCSIKLRALLTICLFSLMP